MLKVRVKFSKEGAMKFIGHLDIMRYFQKSIRRANIPIAFSGGFSPVRGSRPAPPGERDGGPAAGRRPTGGPHSGGLLGGSAGQPGPVLRRPAAGTGGPHRRSGGTGGAAPPLGPLYPSPGRGPSGAG